MDIVTLTVDRRAAAIVGDNVGFAIGRRYGRRLFLVPGPLPRHRAEGARARRAVLRHATARRPCSSAAGSPGLRIASAWLAGMNKMAGRRSCSGTRSAASPGRRASTLSVYFLGRLAEHAIDVVGPAPRGRRRGARWSASWSTGAGAARSRRGRPARAATASSRRRLAADRGQQRARGGLAELRVVDAHRRQRGRGERGQRRVVEAGDRDVARARSSPSSRAADHDRQREHVARADDRGRAPSSTAARRRAGPRACSTGPAAARPRPRAARQRASRTCTCSILRAPAEEPDPLVAERRPGARPAAAIPSSWRVSTHGNGHVARRAGRRARPGRRRPRAARSADRRPRRR